MVGNRFGAVLLCLVMMGCGPAGDGAALTADRALAIDALLAREMQQHHVPGLAVAVMKDGAVVLQTTKGLSDRAAAKIVSAETAFRLASTTKPFTATAVMQLVADRRLKLSDRIGALLDGLPEPWQAVTVRQLLSHTSGLPDVALTPGQLDLIAGTWEEALPLLRSAPMQFAPGERWAYTQTNYVLLAKIIERLSGMSLQAFMTERLFKPLGMEHTFFPDVGRSCATNYEPTTGDALAERALTFPPYVAGAGGLCASLGDLIRWNKALDDGRILPPTIALDMWTETTLNDGSPARVAGALGYGLGWVVDATMKQRWVGHSGGNSSAIRRYIDEHLTIIVLHNGVADPDALISSVADITRGVAVSAEMKLWDASIAGDARAIEAALDANADIEALDLRKNRSGRRALNWAAFYDHAGAVRVLLARGAKIEAENHTGFTALHHAAEAGAMNAANVLLAEGADPTHGNRAGGTPAETARSQGHAALAAILDDAVAKWRP